jgi:exopolyphosphatase/guanosine-5'-triphosphate,3'-diphosphate pyrophosphatase
VTSGAAIVPRWEWRTFGDEFGGAEDRLDALEPERVEESEELYLLSAAGADTVKVRGGLLDVKHLRQVNADGLEQWLPVLKAAFPVPAADVASALAALGVEDRPLERERYSLEELLGELVEPDARLLAVQVNKRRARHTVVGCTAELTDVRTERGATRTIAVESADPADVIAAVHELGLRGRPNVSYPRGLAELVGCGVRRHAALDVGTNSVKLHVGERRPDGSWQAVADRVEITRLGEGRDATGRLAAEPVERTVVAIEGLVDEARRHGSQAIAAVGTAGLRAAPNAAELLDAVRARTGVEIEVISGEEEARLAFLAVKAELGLGNGSLVVFDTGGGSSQFTFGAGDRVDEQFSVNVGAARLTEAYGLDRPISEETLAGALVAVAAELGRLDGRPAPDSVVGLGGAVTNLAAVKHGLETYDPDIVQGTVLDLPEIDRQLELYRTRTADERREIAGLQPKRAEVILAGACIVRTVLAKLGAGSLTVSDRGLRHGLLRERFGA